MIVTPVYYLHAKYIIVNKIDKKYSLHWGYALIKHHAANKMCNFLNSYNAYEIQH